jgi:hypothetical protein
MIKLFINMIYFIIFMKLYIIYTIIIKNNPNKYFINPRKYFGFMILIQLMSIMLKYTIFVLLPN